MLSSLPDLAQVAQMPLVNRLNVHDLAMAAYRRGDLSYGEYHEYQKVATSQAEQLLDQISTMEG
jgi:hypothetical protein